MERWNLWNVELVKEKTHHKTKRTATWLKGPIGPISLKFSRKVLKTIRKT